MAACFRRSRWRISEHAPYDYVSRIPVCWHGGRLRVYVRRLSTYFRRPVLAALASIFLLVGCGELPRPFKPGDKSPPGTLESVLGARAGIFVEAISGLPEAQSERLTADLVSALHAHDIAAGRRASNRASYRISGRSDASGRLNWSLGAPNGEILLRFDAQLPASGSVPGSDIRLIEAAAERFAAILNPAANPAKAAPAAVTKSPAATNALTLAVQAVNGAPGDGRISLPRAMRRALASYGLKTEKSLENADFIVLGSVYMGKMADSTANSSAQQSIELEWAVLSPDGERIGTINQNNTVPQGALDGAWGSVARAVAENGAEGIVAMLEQVGALE